MQITSATLTCRSQVLRWPVHWPYAATPRLFLVKIENYLSFDHNIIKLQFHVPKTNTVKPQFCAVRTAHFNTNAAYHHQSGNIVKPSTPEIHCSHTQLAEQHSNYSPAINHRSMAEEQKQK